MAKFTGGIEVQGDANLSGGISNLAAGALTNTEISASAAIARSKLAQDDLAKFGINLSDLRVHDAPASFLPTTASSDDLGLIIGTFATSSMVVQTSDIDGTSVTQYARFFFTLPHNYVDGETVGVSAYSGMITGTCSADCTLDVEAYEADGESGIGSDLCITAAQSIDSTSFATKTFQLTQTGLISGDTLDIRLTIAGTDDGTGGAKLGTIGKLWMVCDVKG